MHLSKGFYPIIDESLLKEQSPYQLAEYFLSKGYQTLQLRLKNYKIEDFLPVAQEIYYLKIHNPFTFIINHHVDLARELGADGAHLTYQSMSVAEARKILGPDKIIGVSVHSREEAIQKEKEGANYVTLGAIYKTKSKLEDYPALGLDVLKKTCAALQIPVFAIGGINSSNINDVTSVGVAGFCALGAAFETSKALTNDNK
ncbi:thiamine phosphate synthase [bacterium]|nr:thiamine phosphate synthase [bacterium]